MAKVTANMGMTTVQGNEVSRRKRPGMKKLLSYLRRGGRGLEKMVVEMAPFAKKKGSTPQVLARRGRKGKTGSRGPVGGGSLLGKNHLC